MNLRLYLTQAAEAELDEAAEALASYQEARDALRDSETALTSAWRQPASMLDGWREVTVADVVNFGGGHAFPKVEQGAVEGDYPFFKVRHERRGQRARAGDPRTGSPNHKMENLHTLWRHDQRGEGKRL